MIVNGQRASINKPRGDHVIIRASAPHFLLAFMCETVPGSFNGEERPGTRAISIPSNDGDNGR